MTIKIKELDLDKHIELNLEERKFIALEDTCIYFEDLETKEIKKGEIVTMAELDAAIVYDLCDGGSYDAIIFMLKSFAEVY